MFSGFSGSVGIVISKGPGERIRVGVIESQNSWESPFPRADRLRDLPVPRDQKTKHRGRSRRWERPTLRKEGEEK